MASAVSVNSITITNYGGTVTDSASTINVATTFSVASGAFVVGATGVTIGGTLTISGGSFTSSSTAMQVGGSFTHTGGTFVSNGGTLTLVGTSAAGQITTGGADLSLLTINGSGGTYTLQDDLTTTGALTVTAGTLTASAHNVTIGGELTLNGGTFNASSAISLGGRGLHQEQRDVQRQRRHVLLQWHLDAHAHLRGRAVGRRPGRPRDQRVGRVLELDETSEPRRRLVGQRQRRTWNSSGVSRTTAVPGTISFTNPRAVTLDGATGYVTLGTNNLPANDAPQSISLWFKGQPNGNNENFFVMANSVSGSAVQIGYRGTSLIVWNWGGTTLVNTTAPNDNNWHQVVYSFDGATDKLYLDGTLSASVTGTPHQTGTPTSAYLGTYSPNNEMFVGSLDDVRVYTRALTTVEVAILSGGASPTAIAGNHTLGDAFSGAREPEHRGRHRHRHERAHRGRKLVQHRRKRLRRHRARHPDQHVDRGDAHLGWRQLRLAHRQRQRRVLRIRGQSLRHRKPHRHGRRHDRARDRVTGGGNYSNAGAFNDMVRSR